MFCFPEIQTTRTAEEQTAKIAEEIEEFKEAYSDEEAIDILHATETFIRIHFRGREEVLDKLVKDVIAKNTKRGYYKEKCY